MTDEQTTHAVDATVQREVPYRPWWAGLAIRYEKLVAALPSHRDTKKGRANAKQIKVVLLAAGVALIGFVGGYWIILGCALAASALFLPMSQDTRRSIVARSRSSRKNMTRVETTPAQIVWDGRRVILKVGDDNVRRVLTHKGTHKIERRDMRGAEVVGILPTSRKKSESIWIVTEGRTPQGLDDLNRDDVDLLASADGDAIYDLLAAMES